MLVISATQEAKAGKFKDSLGNLDPVAKNKKD